MPGGCAGVRGAPYFSFRLSLTRYSCLKILFAGWSGYGFLSSCCRHLSLTHTHFLCVCVCLCVSLCVCVAHLISRVQALLLALGIKARRLGAAAAMSWVLKDALGKFGRILWASKMGRRFDSDAKRWRFRSRCLMCDIFVLQARPRRLYCIIGVTCVSNRIAACVLVCGWVCEVVRARGGGGRWVGVEVGTACVLVFPPILSLFQ